MNAINIRVSFKKDMAYTSVLLGLVIILLITNSWYVSRQERWDREYISHAGELRVLSQTVAKDASEALEGNLNAFLPLKESALKFTHYIEILKNGKEDAQGYLPSTPDDQKEPLYLLDSMWHSVKEKTDLIIINEKGFSTLHDKAKQLDSRIRELQNHAQMFTEALLKKQASSDVVMTAAEQLLSSEKMLHEISKISQAGSSTKDSSDAFLKDVVEFQDVLIKLRQKVGVDPALQKGSEPEQHLTHLEMFFSQVQAESTDFVQYAAIMAKLRSSAQDIFTNSQKLLEQATALTDAYTMAIQERFIGNKSEYILGFITLMLLLFLSYRAHKNAQMDLSLTRAQNERNQMAINKLLSELADLANGNLTAHATVNDEITGAIAESVNYAINALRKLVLTINETTTEVASAAHLSQLTARQLAEASEHQSREIVGASNSINAMALSIEQVSTNATQSTSVAERSVNIANNGVAVVKNTILGMEKIREQIQETARRIKRLGESSHEIGTTLSVIDDIAEQTNILALNAAIQAAMAGDAGRGFAVVADEVQRLSERSSLSTKGIETIVRTIQNDISQVVVATEQTLVEVAQGVRLAQDAGVALEKVEKVSSQLSELIQNISNAALQQAQTASKISKTMGVIQEITSKTALGTVETADSIVNLAELVSDLRHSVAGFKLPSAIG